MSSAKSSSRILAEASISSALNIVQRLSLNSAVYASIAIQSTMKRKLDDNDVPTPVVLPLNGATGTRSFESLGLDVRLLQAIGQEKYTAPTPVQSQAIPLALKGKDILGKLMA